MNHTTLLGIGIFLVLLALACCVPANGQNYNPYPYGAPYQQYGGGFSGTCSGSVPPSCSGQLPTAPAIIGYQPVYGRVATAPTGCSGYSAPYGSGYGASGYPREPLFGHALNNWAHRRVARQQGGAAGYGVGCAGY